MRARNSGPPLAGIVAEHAHLAGVGAAVALEDLDRGRLAGAVGAEEAEDLAAVDGEVDALEGFDVAVATCAGRALR